MSSPRRIAANRRNAIRSTGPLTAAGKLRASRNAKKHGLSVSVCNDPRILSDVEALAMTIAGRDATPRLLQAARGIAEAHLELRRLRDFKLALIDVDATILRAPHTAAGSEHPDDGEGQMTEYNTRAFVRTLPLLATLDRYERRAQSRNRRAFQIYAIATED